LFFLSAAVSGPTKLYVSNLLENLTEDDVKSFFVPFGEIEQVVLQLEPGTSILKGASVQFKKSEDARYALEKMNGLDIAGKLLKVGLIGDKDVGMGGTTLEEMEGGAFRLNSQSRAQLMMNLNREVGLQLPVSANPTRTVLLKNLFDPAEETEPNWPEDIKVDVTEECSKFGGVLHAHVDKDSLGFVYLKFETVQGAQAAYQTLNGRKFSGRQIAVDYIPEALYHAQFPASVSG